MDKPIDHPDYVVPGTNIVRFSKWSRENIPKPPHRLPAGQIVRCKVDDYHGTVEGTDIRVVGRAVLIVVGHHFDCDGTALYVVGIKPVLYPLGSLAEKMEYERWCGKPWTGLPEESLTPIQGKVAAVETFADYMRPMREWLAPQ